MVLLVNIGVDFEIICYSNYNKREVLTNCLTQITRYFEIDNWTFNKPINISEIELILANVEGVMSVPSVKISNLCGGDGNYSTNRYNIEEATKGKIVYPSLDPCNIRSKISKQRHKREGFIMHKFFTSSYDASIYLQQPDQNAGRDEILEVGKLYYGSI
jgi:hypothetical protein